MCATPIIPGKLYQVRGAGLNTTIIATNGCDAICIAIDILEGAAC